MGEGVALVPNAALRDSPDSGKPPHQLGGLPVTQRISQQLLKLSQFLTF